LFLTNLFERERELDRELVELMVEDLSVLVADFGSAEEMNVVDVTVDDSLGGFVDHVDELRSCSRHLEPFFFVHLHPLFVEDLVVDVDLEVVLEAEVEDWFGGDELGLGPEEEEWARLSLFEQGCEDVCQEFLLDVGVEVDESTPCIHWNDLAHGLVGNLGEWVLVVFSHYSKVKCQNGYCWSVKCQMTEKVKKWWKNDFLGEL
jgi:hypothetical protein